MKVLLSWVRDFVDVPETPEAVGRQLSLRGLALGGVEPAPADVLPPGRTDAGLADAVLDFDVTANRPDCLSVLGIAREIAAVYGRPLRVPGPQAMGLLATPALTPGTEDGLTVRIEAPTLCARYAGATARVRVGPSPAWVQGRLQALGVRPISNIVDITNYVLLELGQPLHAFDHARLAGGTIVVRTATAGEPLTTLDGKARTLTADTLVIADSTRAVAIAGVMGGADSEVSADTTRIVFESAWFRPQSVRATSKRLALRSEASVRFERGVDPRGTVEAMARACALLTHLGAGEASGLVVDAHPAPSAPVVLTLSRTQIDGLLGMPVPDADCTRILQALGFTTEADGPSRWRVTVPGWRVDIARPVDLIEEIGRHYGYEHLPTRFPAVHQAPPPSDPRIARDRKVRQALLGAGCSEAITFAFIEQRAAAPFLHGDPPLALANPLSELFAVMRPSLLPGLIDAVSHNRRHGRRDVQLFEIGTRFSPRGESRSAAIAWTGLASADHWGGHRRAVDFFDLKGLIERICAGFGASPDLTPLTCPYLVEGRAADVHVHGQWVGRLGQVTPDWLDLRELPRADEVYVAELDLDALSSAAAATDLRVVPLPRHPAVVRDVSILVPDGLSAADVFATIRQAAPATLADLQLFDRYQGRGIPDGQVSLSLRLTFRAADRTLTDAEVQEAMQAVLQALVQTHGAVQR